MPLFFLLAGAGTYYALRSRKAILFAADRSLRLLVPLLFGMVVIVAPQAYYEAISHGVGLNGNLLQLYGGFLKDFTGLNWYHLWFLAYLFVFSIITLPLFVSRRGIDKSIISRISAVCDKPWVLLPALIIPLAIFDAFLYPGGFWGDKSNGGWTVISNLLFFVSGYFIFANARIIETIKKIGWVTLGTAVIAIVCLVVFFIDPLGNPTDFFGTTQYIAAQFVQALNTWCWLLAILSLGTRYLTKNNKFLTYSNEAVLPFYILHQTVIIVIGFYVVQWNTGIGLKYLATTVSSFIVIMAIYELLIRRIPIFRFLFGMGSKRKPPTSPIVPVSH